VGKLVSEALVMWESQRLMLFDDISVNEKEALASACWQWLDLSEFSVEKLSGALKGVGNGKDDPV